MIRKIVLKPGQICSVRVTPPHRGSTAILRVDDYERESGETRQLNWDAGSLKQGVRWELSAGHTYTVRLHLGVRADSRVRISFISEDNGEEFVDEFLRGTQVWKIITTGSKRSHREEGERDLLGGGGRARGSRDRESEELSPEPGGSDWPGRDSEESSPSRAERRNTPWPISITPLSPIIPFPSSETGGRARGSRDRESEELSPKPGGSDWPGWLEELELESVSFRKRRSRALVSTGFSLQAEPDGYMKDERPLLLSGDYYFWFEVGESRAPGAVDEVSPPLNVKGMVEGARLDVVLFAFEGEFGIEPGRDVGILVLYGKEDHRGERAVRVLRNPATPDNLSDPELLTRRLFFPVRMPRQAGTYRLRCNVYHKQVLLQSRLVTVEVAADQDGRGRKVLKTELDYKISEQLRSEILKGIGEHVLSMMLNDNGDGTHGFRFYGRNGGNPFKNEASILDSELTAKIENGRKQLRQVAWGSPKEWNKDKYRYEQARPIADLKRDLIDLARAGFRIYDDLAGRLAKQPGKDDRPARWELEDLMRTTGRVQIAAKSSAKRVVPAALFYDYSFSDGEADEKKFDLCPVFLDALENNKALLETACFQGNCPTVKDKYVVCPSGFWGYRHEIGFPTVEKRDAFPWIPYQEHPQLLVAVSTDKNFRERVAHEGNLKKMVKPSAWHYAADAADALALMKEDKAQVVYFYCHGGKTLDSTPYLEVGPRGNATVITKGELHNERIYWTKHPPLVFINGCYTTALDPEAASDLVSGFRESNAVGVIGTEITIFESLACSIAESFFGYFLDARDPKEVGDALRRARIDLLQKGNPLGLVYIPFVLASVKLREGM